MNFMNYLKQSFELIRDTATNFGRDNATMLAAGLAYYTIFAIAPLLVIAVAVAGFVYGEAAVQGEIVGAIEDTVGTQAATIIENLIASARESGATIWATLLSIGVLIWGSSNLFGQLQRALNTIWGIAPAPDAGVLNVVRKRAVAFSMVLLLGFFLLLSLAASTIVTALGDFLTELLPGLGSLLPTAELFVSLFILILLFATLFRVLPDVEVAWRDVLLGAAVTAVLFVLGRYLISWYLGTRSFSSTYGAAGSLVVLLLFVYYSAQIILFGAEFTQTYANKFGSRLRPAENAIKITRQGIETAEDVMMARPDPAASMPPRPVVAERPLSPPQPSPPQTRRQVAAILFGMALGLLLAFLNKLRNRT